MELTEPPHPAAVPTDKLMRDCQPRRGRRSGPGGQHRNKVETAVALTHEPTGVTAEASERRSQAENLKAALFRLRVRLALGVRTPAALDPSPLWASRTKGQRIAVNPTHDDFPAMLAEALDVLAASDWDDRAAAERLKVTRTQLVRFLKSTPRAIEELNSQRRERGMAPLR